jgi:hypothetical protein
MAYNVIDKAQELLDEVEESLTNINEELEVLESFDWHEVFPNTEDTDTREVIQDAIMNIRINVRNLEI